MQTTPVPFGITKDEIDNISRKDECNSLFLSSPLDSRGEVEEPDLTSTSKGETSDLKSPFALVPTFFKLNYPRFKGKQLSFALTFLFSSSIKIF